MTARTILPDGWREPVLVPDGSVSLRLLQWLRGHELQSFLRDVERVDAAQQAALARVLDGLRGTAFAREQGLNVDGGLAALRATVPIRPAEELAPWLDRVAGGEPRVLTRRQVVSMLQTSGTTAARKLLPVTAPWAAEVARAQGVWVTAMTFEQPGLAAPGARVFATVGRQIEGRTAAGVPYGSNTGRMRAAQPWWVRLRYATPAGLADLPDYLTRSYVALRLALAVDVRSWTTANPSTVLAACRLLDRFREDLRADLVDGTLRRGPAAALAPADRRRLAPWVWRRRSLPERWTPLALWPNLLCVNCWKGGQAGFAVERLPAALGGPLTIREVGISASEGHLAVPLHSSWDGGVFDAGGGFVEWVPADGGEPALAADLEIGRTYRIVLSTTAGLARYDLGDLVEVVGWWRGAPLLRFVGRAGETSSLTGEKLTGAQVVAAARAALPGPVTGFVLAAAPGDPGRYILGIEGAAPEGIGASFDAELQGRNIEYASKRATDRLDAVRCVRLPAGTLDRWRSERAARGVADGQLKDPIFVPLETLEGAVAGVASARGAQS